MKNKAQVTIFIIVGIIIIALILLFLFLRSRTGPSPGGQPETSPSAFLETCLKDTIFEAVDLISVQGGYANPPNLSIGFKFTDEPSLIQTAYLCFSENHNQRCVNQEPMLFQHIEDEIKEYIKPEVENCFNKLGKSLETAGYTVEARHKAGDFNVELKKGLVDVKINGELTLTKTRETKTEKNFGFTVPSSIFQLTSIVHEIVKQQSVYCGFRVDGFLIFYRKFNPQINIDTYTKTDSTVIYRIEDEKTKERFRFAIKSCTRPPGFG
jgi:hypothetical protein